VRGALAASIVLLLFACSGGSQYDPAPQKWLGNAVAVQTRPAPVEAGMNEFIIIATQPRGLPVADLRVMIRLSDDEPWRQAIEDGETGVFRRALALREGERVLQVQLITGSDTGVLRFLLPQPGG